MTRVLALALAVSAATSLGCGRANPRIDTVTRTEGDFVVVSELGYDKDGFVANVRRVEGEGGPVKDDFTDLTWLDGHLTEVERTLTFDEFLSVATTTLEYDGDLVVTASTTTVILRPDQDPQPVSEEAFVMEYDDQLFEGFTRTFEDEQRNKSSTVLALVHDAAGLLEVREDSSFINNGAPDLEIARVTSIEYANGRPSTLRIVENEGRETTIDIAYKSGALEVMSLAIPTLDEFNNELVVEGTNNYRFDSDDRLVGVDIESDAAQTVTYEIEYQTGDDEGEATGIDLMPAGALPVPLWDLKGHAYEFIDARTQLPRFVGASW